MGEGDVLMIRKGLVVSCQALEGNPLRDPAIMAIMAKAAEMGGACAIRANGADDERRFNAHRRGPEY